MPVIPRYEAQQSLDPDIRGAPHVSFDKSEFTAAEQQGRALQGLGSSLSTALSGLSRQTAAQPAQDAGASLDAPVTPSPAMRAVQPQVTPAAAPTSSTTPGPAAEGAANAARVALNARRTTDFSTGLQDDTRRQAIQGALDGAQGAMLPNGAGFMDSFLKTADEMAADSFKQMPPGPARDAAVAGWPAERRGWVDRAATIQVAAQKQYSLSQLDSSGRTR